MEGGIHPLTRGMNLSPLPPRKDAVRAGSDLLRNTRREAIIKASPRTRRNFFRVYPVVYLARLVLESPDSKVHAHGRRFDSRASAEQFQGRADYTGYAVLSGVLRGWILPRPSTRFHDEFMSIHRERISQRS